MSNGRPSTTPQSSLIAALRERAATEPIGCDLSDWSDEFVAGFLAGQANLVDVLAEPETYAYANVPFRIEAT